jgi:Ca-activated chloride channel family protein
MDFLWPGFFILLTLVPLLVVVYIWILRRRKRFTVRFSSLSLVQSAVPRQSRWRRHIPFALFLLALASLILALVRPVTIVSVPVTNRTVVLAIDVSRSMCATDIEPNRLEAAKKAAISFVQDQGGDSRIGIVAFAGFAVIVQPPTNDQELLLDAIENLSTARRTAIGTGILKSIDAIAEFDKSIAPSVFGPSAGTEEVTPVPEGAYAPAIIVVLTDGVSNVGPHPLDAAQQAQDRGIRVYTIGFGTANPGSMRNCNPGAQPSENQFGFGGGSFGGGGGGYRRGIDEVTLQEIAKMTGGEYYSAESLDDLQNVFRILPTDLITKNETMEITVFLVAIGVFLLVFSLALSFLWNPVV